MSFQGGDDYGDMFALKVRFRRALIVLLLLNLSLVALYCLDAVVIAIAGWVVQVAITLFWSIPRTLFFAWKQRVPLNVAAMKSIVSYRDVWEHIQWP